MHADTRKSIELFVFNAILFLRNLKRCPSPLLGPTCGAQLIGEGGTEIILEIKKKFYNSLIFLGLSQSSVTLYLMQNACMWEYFKLPLYLAACGRPKLGVVSLQFAHTIIIASHIFSDFCLLHKCVLYGLILSACLEMIVIRGTQKLLYKGAWHVSHVAGNATRSRVNSGCSCHKTPFFVSNACPRTN